MIFHDILNSSLPLVTQHAMRLLCDFPPHGKRISGTQIGKTAVDENKAPGHIRMQDDAGGTIVVKSSVQYICLDLRPCSVDLGIFRTRIAQWGISILVGLVN